MSVDMNVPEVATMGNNFATWATTLQPDVANLETTSELLGSEVGDIAGASQLATEANAARAAVATLGNAITETLAVDSEYVLLAAALAEEAFNG
ncbi:hypothetical protein [Brevibacterium samyangense]|uniref:Excreted virulence factor EspC, type VII ESX diderm n=1 Tax=Brevibacterium samyangense TaxID=366888 RepID=A0ABN2TJB6_9MICO